MWNYRLMRRVYLNPITNLEDVVYGIYEVYYDEQGNPDGWSEHPENVSSESVDGIQWQVEKFKEALIKPMLEYNDGSEASNRDAERFEDAPR